MSHLTRWFVLLGLFAALSAAILLGIGAGGVLRDPDNGLAPLFEHEALAIALVVGATFLFSTAVGIRDSRRWALLLGIAEAAVLMAAGVGALVGGGAIIRALGGSVQLVLATLPLGLAAMLLGARLLVALWRASDLALPVSRTDLQAVGTLAGITAMALLGHVLAAGVAS